MLSRRKATSGSFTHFLAYFLAVVLNHLIGIVLSLLCTKRPSFFFFPLKFAVSGWAAICRFLWGSAPQNRLVPAGLRPAGIYAKISKIKLPHPRLPSNNPIYVSWDSPDTHHHENEAQKSYGTPPVKESFL